VSPEPLQWRVVAATTRGASHCRLGRPNQDAVAWYQTEGDFPFIAVAISDGHGSNKCFRSDMGSRLAVSVAVRELEGFARRQPSADMADIKDRSKELARQIVVAWQAGVRDALVANPLTSEELSTLEGQDGCQSRSVLEENPLVAYGATIICALLVPSFIAFLQLGDGDILSVAQSGDVTRPMASDPRLFANETTSLCLPEAWKAMRVECLALSSAPAMVLLSTDGYANSFKQDADFLKVGVDLLDVARVQGLDCISANLESWLAETSSGGSGDDITLALISRLDLRTTMKPGATEP
jgi:hypothetical protein